MTDRPRTAVFVAQLPPPVHGQAAANALLSGATFDGLQLAVVPMQMSEDVADVSRFQVRKVLRLASVIRKARQVQRQTGAATLIYAVGLRNRVALARDVVALLALRRSFDRTIFHVHTGAADEVIDGAGWPLRPLARRAYRRAAVIYLDPALGNADRGLPEPLSVRFLGYGIPDPRPSEPSRPEHRTGPPTVLFVGNLYDSKGTVALIDATGELVRRGVPIRVVFVGADPDGGTTERLRARAEACGAGDHVELLGARYGAEKEQLFAQADLFCFPTAYEAEGMPLVVLEAMAHGLAVVATRWRAIPSMVEDGVTGRLVPVGDTTALADALAGLLADPHTFEAMGQRGRARFLERFTTETFLECFEHLVLEASATPVPSLRPTGSELLDGTLP